MGNTILTSDIIAKEALMQLRNNSVMAGLVHRDYSNEFVAGVGDTITVRKPASFEAKEFSSAIQVQDATETGVTVKMDKLLDVSFAVSSKQMSLDIKDFSEQLLVPAMNAFAEKIDGYLLGLASSVTNSVTPTAIKADIIAARKYLVDGKAPLTNRNLVVGSAEEAAILGASEFSAYDKTGSTDALRNASLGRIYGMDTFCDQNCTDIAGLAFHKNAFALVTRPLAVAQGAKSSIVNYDGFGLRVTYGYDISSKQDIVSIDMLCGVAVLDKNLAAKIANPS